MSCFMLCLLTETKVYLGTDLLPTLAVHTDSVLDMHMDFTFNKQFG